MFSTSTSLKFSINSRLLIAIMISLMMITVSGCKKDKKFDDGLSASQIYDAAKKYLVQQNWARAVRAYQGLSTRYPFGRFTEQAQLELAYAYHKSGNPEAAEAGWPRARTRRPSSTRS